MNIKPANLLKFTLFSLFALLVSCEPDEGPVDESDVRDDFIGRWAVSATSNINGSSTYTVDIDYDTTSTDMVELINFHNYSNSQFVLGKVNTTAEQVIQIAIQDLDGNSVSGFATSGDSDELNFEYVFDNGIEADSVNALFVKQQ